MHIVACSLAFLSCTLYIQHLSVLYCREKTHLEYGMGSGRGGIGISWMLGPILIPNLEHIQDLVGCFRSVS